MHALRRQTIAARVAIGDLCGSTSPKSARLPLERLNAIFEPYTTPNSSALLKAAKNRPEKALVIARIAEDLLGRLAVLLDLGIGYITLDRSTPTLSPGELQRLRLATQVRSNLFGVSTFSTSHPPDSTHPIRRRFCARSINSKPPEICSSSWSMRST